MPQADQPAGGRRRPAGDEPVVIKKYANRRLYNTASSSYVTLDHLADMVREGVDFVVYDAKTNEDLTRSVLTQIIFDEENKGPQNLLPLQFLRQLIRLYGDSMQALLPSYLEMSLDGFARQRRSRLGRRLGVVRQRSRGGAVRVRIGRGPEPAEGPGRRDAAADPATGSQELTPGPGTTLAVTGC